ncbi:helix-turn-helix transcriptional regulator [Cellulomonas sp. C5510]|nr:helix-turn-helix transcriptional regulator [Cellulomonas sp. C5510]
MSPAARAGTAPGVPVLSERERVVLRELVSAQTLDEVAGRLYVSRNTVKSQVLSIHRKLGVTCRADAVAWARAHLPDVAGPGRTGGGAEVGAGAGVAAPRATAVPARPLGAPRRPGP